ncbi:hypothetical protein HDZ31DRAFT_83419 [Schizophyllum fasciatum]
MPVQQSARTKSSMCRSAKPYADPSSSKGPAEPRRPPNAFMVFRSWYIAHQHPSEDKRQRGISKKAGAIWVAMSDAEKLPFERKAQDVLRQFRKEHPDYDWNKPRSPSPKSSPSPSTRSASAAASSSVQASAPPDRAATEAASDHEGPAFSPDDPFFYAQPGTYPDIDSYGNVNYDQLSQYAIRPHKRADADSIFLGDDSSGYDDY